MTTSTIPLWGRGWKLSVGLQSGDSLILTQNSFDPEALRVTFDILESTLPSPFWYADVTVYNCNKPGIQNLLYNAQWLTLEAGYQSGPSKSSIIWDGPVLQVLFDRQDVTDLTVRFNCVATTALIEKSFVNVSVGAQSSQYQAVSKMISQMGGNAGEQVSDLARDKLSAKQYPRGRTFFGKTSKYLSDMADDHFLGTWVRGNQQYLSEIDNPARSASPQITYGAPLPPGYTGSGSDTSVTRSIIGVPKQSPFGCTFTVLLDPRLKVSVPPMLIKLDQTIIQQLKLQYGQVLTPLDQNGLYIAGQVRHYGDTRGNDWHTEVTGYARGYAQGLLNGTFVAAAAGTK